MSDEGPDAAILAAGAPRLAHARPLAGAAGVGHAPNEKQQVGPKTLFLVMSLSKGVGIFGLEHIATHHSSPNSYHFSARRFEALLGICLAQTRRTL